MARTTKPVPPPPKDDLPILMQRFRAVEKWVEQARRAASLLDHLGEAQQHPKGSQAKVLAEARDEFDLFLVRCQRAVNSDVGFRAQYTNNQELLLDVIGDARGNGHEYLRLMERYHKLFGDDSKPDGTASAETFPEMFAWDVYQRVSALADLAEKYPNHVRHAARAMHGWPMVVSHHLDHRPEFRRLAEKLQIGAAYPLDAQPRKKRGTETPLLRYLEPLVTRLHEFRKFMLQTERSHAKDDPAERLRYAWQGYALPDPRPELVAVLRRAPGLPPLNRKTARAWSSQLIVPIILLEDAPDREHCKVPALRSIWRHRSVKSLATFKSRLHSAVTDTLERFARAE